MPDQKHVEFPGHLLMLGFGSIGQGVLPLIMRHIGIRPERITILSAHDNGREEAGRYGIRFVKATLKQENFRQILEPLLPPSGFLLNLSVEVSSIEVIKLCWERETLYLDTCIEPWAGGYTDPHIPLAQRTNYALREELLAERKLHKKAPTAVVVHGANPGMVSHLLKQALLNVAADIGLRVRTPRIREEWAKLAQRLGVRTIHVAERDTQLVSRPKQPNEFVNTWSVNGMCSESAAPAELGWGTHERTFPEDGRGYASGSKAAIYLAHPGGAVGVRSWVPSGPYHGFCIPHTESVTTAEYLTVAQKGKAVYRPTVHYAYLPCDGAVASLNELAGRHWKPQERQRILRDEIVQGVDELGVLLAGHARNAYWFGSQLSIEQAREAAPYNSATSLQVTSSVLAGVIWAMENPRRGFTEPEEMDHQRVLEICRPYLGTVAGYYTDWTPLHGRSELYPEEIDSSDPWQFQNVRVFTHGVSDALPPKVATAPRRRAVPKKAPPAARRR